MNDNVGVSLLRTEFPRITGLPIEEWLPEPVAEESRWDVRFRAGGHWFIVDFKAAATTEQIGSALRHVSSLIHSRDIPLLVVPYMGDAGREMCQAAAVDWLDLSGNARIQTPSLHIRIQGEPNQYKRSGRPVSLFAPKSARVARLFLTDVAREWSQTELAGESGLSAGYLSRLLPRYEEAGFVTSRNEGRALRYRVTQPDALLDAWYADYDFNHHLILRGHIAARSGVELLRDLAASLTRRKVAYTVTGLAASWLWQPFAAFRTVTLYLADLPSQVILSDIGFHEGSRGNNTWLVIPNDEGVLAGAMERDGVRCVAPVQTYLDLKSQPERSEEAREELRRMHLTWANTTESNR